MQTVENPVLFVKSLWRHLQGEHLSGKPGNVREFETCQGSVREFANSLRELSRNKPCHGKWYQKLIVASWSCHLLHNEVMLKFIFWSLTLTLVIQACYEYHLTWARVPRIVTEMSGNFAVSGEWSPCTCLFVAAVCLQANSCLGEDWLGWLRSGRLKAHPATQLKNASRKFSGTKIRELRGTKCSKTHPQA